MLVTELGVVHPSSRAGPLITHEIGCFTCRLGNISSSFCVGLELLVFQISHSDTSSLC